MGVFSFLFADTQNTGSLRIGRSAYVVLPDGTSMYAHYYDGYGNFDERNIFEMVAEWNKDYLSVSNLCKPERSDYDESDFQSVMQQYEYSCRRLTDFISGVSEQEMELRYGSDWKMEIGIDVACYDEQNAMLRFPIKICKEEPDNAKNVPASKSDPKQGCS